MKQSPDNSLLSVGIDIGTSTTQVIFSRLQMANTASYFAVPKISIVAKDVVYKGGIHETPLLDLQKIDMEAIRRIIEWEYASAGCTPAAVGTGAVIITGESARKENANAAVQALSGFAGDFVVATAGPDLEAVIAGKGSGAQQYSADNNCVVMNLDIGGGTTNIAVFEGERILSKACLDIGGRLVRYDESGIVTYVSPAAAKVAQTLGLALSVGSHANETLLSALSKKMANLLDQLLGLAPKELLLDDLQTRGSTPFSCPKPIAALCFSGGVADAIYFMQNDYQQYKDIGVYLGASIRESSLTRAFTVIKPKETIRATVIGAGSYTTTVSGSTIHYSPNLFPLKNIPVLRLSDEEERALFAGSLDLQGPFRWFLEQSGAENIVISLKGKTDVRYDELQAAAAVFARCVHAHLPTRLPALISLERDMAKALGVVLRQAMPERPLLCVDGIYAEHNDYMDFGNPLMGGLVIPVVVKSLIFG
ncbi:MAG: ethanolamine ammonia-lyase reactivating factor EutA [Oscillospiraceae bacterium]|nr:ethanolamine ammonia-lyase reactivating factor EutA [Oscillospiraceae bacterium]